MNQRSPSKVTKPSSWALLAILSVAALSLTGCGKETKDAKKTTVPSSKAAAVSGLESDEQRVSYGVGYNMGSSLNKQTDFSVDKDALRVGLEDGIGGSKTKIPEADLQAAFANMQQKAMANQSAAAEKNLAASAAFLAKNKTRHGVTTTASGLQYEVITPGKGPKPKSSDTVEVHYHGTLTDGTVFDSSVDRGEPATFPVTGVIKGWIEALQLMPVGSKWKLYVPAELGYGPRANGKIPPNAVLIFEVQLLSIK